jgi:hypothetical protein
MTDAQRIWQEKSDDALIEAAAELGTYTAEGQAIIRAELKRRGLEDPVEQARFTASALGVDAPADEADEVDAPPAPECLRCEVRLRYVGEKSFHEGTRWGAIGELGHLFERSSSFDVYVCPQCGHVDFFVHASGE